jgi:CRISPR/Cas system-associated exonuclease Cas4 (RecB family)
MADNKFIRASDIGEYTFCKRVWWLRRNGFLPTTSQMVEGSFKHDALSDKLDSLGFLKTLAIIFVVMGALIFILAILYFSFIKQ